MVKQVKKPGRDRLQSILKNVVATEVKVGYFADQGTHPTAKMNYPSLMYLHEVLGVRSRNGKVHRRAFEITMRMRSKQLLVDTQRVLRKEFGSGGNGDAAKNLFGEEAEKAIKETFGNSSLLPANSPATIKRKGFNAPLIETKELEDHLTHRIVKKGS